MAEFDWADKISKLFTKAEGTDNEAERDTYLARAQSLMDSHAIDMHMIGKADATKREAIERTVWFKDDKNSLLIKARRELLIGLANLNRCRTVMMGRSFVYLFGHVSDLEFVARMHASIMLQLHAAMATAERHADGPIRTWRVNYAHGYVRRVYGRLKATNDHDRIKRDTDTPGTDLVLVDRAKLVKAEVDQAFPKLRTVTMGTSARGESDGYRQGMRDGDRADIGQARVGGSRRPIES